MSESAFFQKVFSWMFLGLLITSLAAFTVSSSSGLTNIILGNPLILISLIILELILVFSLVGFIKRISSTAAVLFFLLYSLITGLTFSVIFLAFTLGSVASIFLITAGMFGIISIYGFITKSDLSRLGPILIMGLIGVILASVVNIFINSAGFDLLIAIIAVIIFTGLTAYDIQKIKNQEPRGNLNSEENKKFAIIGALTLYLDFINLFLSMLRLFGKRR